MSSIRRIQTERALSSIVYQLYSQGRSPLFSDIAERLSKRFSKYPAGSPLPLPLDGDVAQGKSDPDAYNEFLKFMAINLDVLYEASLSQIQDVTELTSALQFHLDRLKQLRRRVETTIDDYLLSLYNTDGYFYALSDVFSDLGLVDLSLTSAYVDTVTGTVVLPTVGSLTTRLSPDLVASPTIQVRTGRSNNPSPFTEIAPYTGAFQDGLTNIAWVFEVETDRPTEVIAQATFPIGSSTEPVDLSRVEFTPYGSIPIQLFVETSDGSGFSSFGRKIVTSDSKMVFNDEVRTCTAVRFTMRKLEPDYVTNDTSRTRYRYLFGARTITLLHQFYERSARLVSSGLYLPETDAGHDYVIDGISLDVDAQVPPNTHIEYYIAPDVEGAESLDDFHWRRIIPIDSEDEGEKVLRFDGANYSSHTVRLTPEEGELQQIPLTGEGIIVDRNPSPSIIPGVDVYRIVELEEEDIILKSLTLTEGLNTTRIYSVPMSTSTSFDELGLEYWSTFIRSDDTDVFYGRIDSGNGFFYGGDVGASARDVYVETYVESPRTYSTFVSEFQKTDPRSRLWPIRIFHNGEEIGYLPVGVDTLHVPWRFKQGVNHVALMLRIPEDGDIASVYAGAVSLLGDRSLMEYGTVRLDNWSYVDFFTMQFNETGQPKTFTIHDGEIISRRKPTTNFLLKYAQDAGNGIRGLRLRADMTRSVNNANITPSIDQYRIRFSFGEGG